MPSLNTLARSAPRPLLLLRRGFAATATSAAGSAKNLPPYLTIKPSPDAPAHPMKSSATDPDLPLPAIIVMSEWWGVNAQTKSHAQRLANGTGCVAIVPDMYNGKIGHDKEVGNYVGIGVFDGGLVRKEGRDQGIRRLDLKNLGRTYGTILAFGLQT